MSWIDYFFYMSGIVAWGILGFKGGTIAGSAIYWGSHDCRWLWKKAIKKYSFWKVLKAMPKTFFKSAYGEIMNRMGGFERIK